MKFLKKNIQLLFFTGLVILMAPYIYLSRFVNAAGDDIAYSLNTLHSNWCCAFVKEYNTWSGSYSSNALVLLSNYFLHHDFVFQLFPVLMLLLTWFSFYFFISSLTTKTWQALVRVNVSLFLTLLYVFMMPTVAQGFFWMTGILAYQLANVVTLLHVAFAINFLQKKIFLHKYIHLLLTAALLAAAIGFNEVVMLMLIAFYLLLFIFAPAEKSVRMFYLAFATLSLGLMLIIFLAPGTTVRESMFPSSHKFFQSVLFTLFQTFRFLFDWISNLPLLAATLVILPFGEIFAKKNILLGKLLSIHPLFYTVSFFLLMFICIFPPYWFTGILGQHRTINTACFFFLPLWFLHAMSWTVHLRKAIPQLNATVSALLIILSMIAMGTTKNGYGTFTDIVYGKAAKYDAEMHSRWEFLTVAKQSKATTAELKPIENKPATLFVLDISDNPGYFCNQAYALYFGLQAVSTKSR